jgi:hypothetical protein
MSMLISYADLSAPARMLPREQPSLPQEQLAVVIVRREKALDFSWCNSRVAADKAASLGGESPTAVSCLIRTASMPDACTGNDA